MGSRKYGRAWKRIRDKYIAQFPKCEMCGKDATEVHHIVPLCKGGTSDKYNLMALCTECHMKIHYEEVKSRNE